MAYDYSQAGYSQDVLDYINGLNARRNELIGKYAGQNVGLDNPDFLTPQQVQQEASDEIKTQYAPEEVVREYMSRNPLNSENNLNAGVDIRSYGDSRDPSVYDMVRLPFGDAYTFTNKATGETRTFSTPQELGAFAQNINSATGGGNNSANWEVTDPSGKTLAYDSPYTPSFLKEYGPYLAAAALAAVVGPTALAWMAAPAAGAAGAAGTAGALGGAGTAAGTAGALGGAGTAAGTLGTAAGIGALDAVTVGALAPSMFSLAAPYVAGGAFAGLTAAQLAQLGQLPSPPTDASTGSYSPDTEAVTVSHSPYVAPSISPAAIVPGALTATQLAQLGQLPSPPTDPYTGQTEEAVVSANKLKPFEITPNLSALTAASAIPAVTLASSLAPPEIPAEDPSALDKYLRYASLGMTGLSLLGGLVGGGGGSGSGSAGTISGDGGKMPANFATDKLPTGDAIPAYGGGTNRQLRDLSGVDWKTYGFRPGIDFYENVPTPSKAAAKGGSMAVKRPAKSYAVQGEGDGRSDDIPAVLSDGEYVIDAETVALLGNGSNKAGAAQLDRFRANVRKHKGKELAKGRFSVNAKNPQAYMAGGRT